MTEIHLCLNESYKVYTKSDVKLKNINITLTINIILTKSSFHSQEPLWIPTSAYTCYLQHIQNLDQLSYGNKSDTNVQITVFCDVIAWNLVHRHQSLGRTYQNTRSHISEHHSTHIHYRENSALSDVKNVVCFHETYFSYPQLRKLYVIYLVWYAYQWMKYMCRHSTWPLFSYFLIHLRILIFYITYSLST